MIEVGEWEHECCGASFDRNSIVDVSCLKVSGTDPLSSTRLVESHHELTTNSETLTYKGRVADIAIVHADGSVEPIHRLPSGQALRGFDDHDDGHLEQPWNGQPVLRDSDRFLLTLIT